MNATKTTTTEPRQPFYLPMDDVNKANELLHQACGVLACVGTGGGAAGDEAVACACWGVESLLKQVEAIVNMRSAQTDGKGAQSTQERAA